MGKEAIVAGSTYGSRHASSVAGAQGGRDEGGYVVAIGDRVHSYSVATLPATPPPRYLYLWPCVPSVWPQSRGPSKSVLARVPAVFDSLSLSTARDREGDTGRGRTGMS